MCLGIPGQLVEVTPASGPTEVAMGKVRFGGITKEACLAHVPEAQVGDYVLVHVGFALSRIDEHEARRIFEFLEQMGGLEEELG
jgi:hydrogenase expression/formation protein HypC